MSSEEEKSRDNSGFLKCGAEGVVRDRGSAAGSSEQTGAGEGIQKPQLPACIQSQSAWLPWSEAPHSPP